MIDYKYAFYATPTSWLTRRQKPKSLKRAVEHAAGFYCCISLNGNVIAMFNAEEAIKETMRLIADRYLCNQFGSIEKAREQRRTTAFANTHYFPNDLPIGFSARICIGWINGFLEGKMAWSEFPNAFVDVPSSGLSSQMRSKNGWLSHLCVRPLEKLRVNLLKHIKERKAA